MNGSRFKQTLGSGRNAFEDEHPLDAIATQTAKMRIMIFSSTCHSRRSIEK